jgi:DNA modification methylase
MLPAGAYVTLEHEYILILRKGHKRVFTNHADKKRRRESALFWEERNTWYSDVWFDIKGTPQKLNDNDARMRSGAYPFEVVYRLINMYSAKEDVVLDPFLGTGTTIAAAMASGRNSFGFEIDRCLEEVINRVKDVIVEISRETIRRRLTAHREFVVQRLKNTGSFKYRNIHYGFPVMTSQERELLFNDPLKVTESGEGALEVEYSVKPQKEFCRNWAVELQ